MQVNYFDKQNKRAKLLGFALLFYLAVCRTVSPTIAMTADSPELVKQGAATVGETKVGDAAEAAGKLVGAAVAELIAGKGAAIVFKGLAALSKTESGALLLAKVAGAASKAKEAVGSLAVPVAARAVEIALTDGGLVNRTLIAETAAMSSASTAEVAEKLAPAGA